MNLVRITKLAEVADPVCHAASWDDFTPGKAQKKPVSLPVAYEIEGYLLKPITIGKRVMVDRIKRNGVEARGVFSSTTVTKIEEGFFETQNSRYKIETL